MLLVSFYALLLQISPALSIKADTRSEKPSIRKALNEKKAEAAARPAPEPERKAPEAAR